MARAMAGDHPDLAPLIDHALLDPHQGRGAVQRCCEEARHFGFAGVCLASRWLEVARELLPRQGSGRGAVPKLVSVVGFPFGAVPAPLKLADPDALCSGDFLRLWPHRHATDGFFAASWVRK